MSSENNLPVFTGRKSELELLRNTWKKAVNSSTSQFVFIQGESGTGKTTLVEYFLQEILTEDVMVARGDCSNLGVGDGSPFSKALEKLFEQIFGKQVLFEQIGTKILKVAPAWMNLITLGKSELLLTAVSNTIEVIKEEAAKSKFTQDHVNMQYVNILLEIAKKHPLILIIENFQWASESTMMQLPLIGQFVENVPFLFIITHRPLIPSECPNLELFKEVHKELSAEQVVCIELDNGIDVKEYLQARYPNNDFPAAFIEKVAEHTERNPLFLYHLFVEWQNNGVIAPRPGKNNEIRWVLTKEEGEYTIPDRLSDLLEKRWKYLDDGMKEILRYASVQGETFATQIISQMMNKENDYYYVYSRVQDNLNERHKFVTGPIDIDVKDSSNEEFFDYYKFTHRFIRDFVYDKEISKGMRRIIHRQVAECMEKMYQERNRIADQLAEHFFECSDYQKSAHYALEAAMYKQGLFQWSDAEELCVRGLKALKKLSVSPENQEMELRFLETSAQGLLKCSRYGEAEQRLEAAAQLAETLHVDDRRLARLYLDLADVVDYAAEDEENKTHLEKVIYYCDKVRNVFGSREIPMDIHLELEADYAFAQNRAGNLEAGIKICQDLIKEAEAEPPTPEIRDRLAYVYNILGITYGDYGDYQKSAEAFNNTIRLADEDNNITYQITPLINLADDYAKLGKLNECTQTIDRALEKARHVGDQDNIAYAYATRGLLLIKMGQWSKAKDELLASIELSNRIKSSWNMPYQCADLATIYIQEHDILKAYHYAELAVKYAEELGYGQEWGYALDAKAQVEMADGKQNEAEQDFMKALDVFEKGNFRYYWAQTLRNLARFYEKKGDRMKAAEYWNAADQVYPLPGPK